VRIKLNAVNDVPVSLLLKMLNDFIDERCGGEWPDQRDPVVALERLMKQKTRDMSFWFLLDAIEKDGFTVPICVNYRGIDENSIMLGNGGHRLSAAILLCLDTIPVYFTTGRGFMHTRITQSKGVPGANRTWPGDTYRDMYMAFVKSHKRLWED